MSSVSTSYFLAVYYGDGIAHRRTERLTDTQINTQTDDEDRHVDRDENRHADRHTDRDTDQQTYCPAIPYPWAANTNPRAPSPPRSVLSLQAGGVFSCPDPFSSHLGRTSSSAVPPLVHETSRLVELQIWERRGQGGRERETHTQRERERGGDRERDRERDNERERGTERETGRGRTDTSNSINLYDRSTDRPRDRSIHRSIGQIGRRTDRQTDRRIDR